MLPQLILFKPIYRRVNFSKYFKAFFMFFLKFFFNSSSTGPPKIGHI